MQYKQEKKEKEREIALLKKEKRMRTRLWGIVMLAVFLFALVIIILMYHKNRLKQSKLIADKLGLEKQRLNEKLEYVNKEITMKIMHLAERNKLNEYIIKQLYAILPKTKKENQNELNSVIKELKQHSNENIMEEFDVRFKNVHKDFYKTLVAQHPSLTSNDLRLCAFLKMNMNTKDIASLTHQSVNSIEVARSRLRKKMELNNTNRNLYSYLAQY